MLTGRQRNPKRSRNSTGIRTAKADFFPFCYELHGRTGDTRLREGALPSIILTTHENRLTVKHFGKETFDFEYKFTYFQLYRLVSPW